MKNYKIYSLNDPTTNEIRYIGQTCQSLNKRLRQHLQKSKDLKSSFYSSNWIKSLTKNNLIPKIVLIKESLDKEECNILEKYYIQFYKEQNLKLTNMTEGGEGCVGFKHSEESRKKLSEIRKLLMTEEAKENLRLKGLSQWENMTAQQHLDNKLNQPNRKNIYQYDLEGNFIRMFMSLREIERELGFFRANITPCIKGVFEQAYGFKWKYE